MTMRRMKKMKDWCVNGWLIEQQPNSFGSRHAYEVCACNAIGFLVGPYIGFGSLKEARAFCERTPFPFYWGA
jgi:hypothetical protein